MKKAQDYILIFIKGLFMGTTEVIQGVSGSSMALILGVYHEFIEALRSIDNEAFRLLKQGRIKTLWHHINGGFLIPLLSGIGVSVLFLTQIANQVLQQYFIYGTSFLFGIILISCILIFRKVKKWSISILFAFIAGVSINYCLTVAPPFSSPNNLIFAFLAGGLAGFVLLFPGLSSAFILLVIGKYEYIVSSFHSAKVLVITVFVMGVLTGLWVASRFIYKILAEFYSTTVALLAGLMLGALNKLWPWRYTYEFVTNGKGDQVPAYDESIVPWRYMALTGKDPQVFQAILMMALGVFLVVLIEKIAAGLKTKF